MEQIVSINEKTLELELHFEKLETIFDKKNKDPISIITICGSNIQNQQNNKNESIPTPEPNTKEILKEIRKTFGNTTFNSKLKTSDGIWIFKEPYPNLKPKCKVFVMYVQGPFEKNLPESVSSALFTLSILLSSVFVINIQNFQIPEELVELFKVPLEFAKLVKTQDSTVTPFQCLNILIHNWNPDSDFEVGKSGGSKYLKEQLEQNIQTAQAENLYQNLKSAFAKVECLILPDKNATVKKLKSTYKKCVEKFLDVLEHQKERKLFLGNHMVSGSFALLFQNLVNSLTEYAAKQAKEVDQKKEQNLAHTLFDTAKGTNTDIIVDGVFAEVEEDKKSEEKGKQMIRNSKKFDSTEADLFRELTKKLNGAKKENQKEPTPKATSPVSNAPDKLERKNTITKIGIKGGSFMKKFKLPSRDKKTDSLPTPQDSRHILKELMKECETQIYSQIQAESSNDDMLIIIETITKQFKEKLEDQLDIDDEDFNRATVKRFDELTREMRNAFLTGSPMPKYEPSPPASENQFEFDQQSISSGISSENRTVAGLTPMRSTSTASKKSDGQDDIAIGIDLGTTYCCMGVVINGGVKIIPNAVGKNTTPSYLVYLPTEKFLIGEAAKKRAAKPNETKLYNVKRILGCSFSDKALQADIKTLPYTVENEDDFPVIKLGNRVVYPEEISAKLLESLVKDAEKFLRKKVTKAVITVPAYFNDTQRKATVNAGEMAGLEVLGIMTEPTAAAIAYKLDITNESAKHFLVFDLGGGTFDVALFRSDGDNIECLAIDGDTHLGGEDFDLRMVDHCVEKFKEETGIDFYEKRNSSNKKDQDETYRKIKRIQMVCEKQKEDFCTSPETEIVVDAIAEDYDLEITMSKETFEEINKAHFEKTIEVVQRVLQSKGLKSNQIEDVILIGGSSKITRIQELLKSYFGMDSLNNTINPDEAVAYGAAVHAAALNAKKDGISNPDDKFLQQIVTMDVQDVTPLSYGIDMQDGRLSVIIPRHTKIPSTCSQRYATTKDFDSSVTVEVYQGEHPLAKQNTSLGKFVIDEIPKKKAGEEVVRVDMSINNNGILVVTATIESTMRTKTITVDSNKNNQIKEKIETVQQQMQRQFSTTSDSGRSSDWD